MIKNQILYHKKSAKLRTKERSAMLLENHFASNFCVLKSITYTFFFLIAYSNPKTFTKDFVSPDMIRYKIYRSGVGSKIY